MEGGKSCDVVEAGIKVEAGVHAGVLDCRGTQIKERGAGSETVKFQKEKASDRADEPAKELVKNDKIASFF
jgi:hypothetical protein